LAVAWPRLVRNGSGRQAGALTTPSFLSPSAGVPDRFGCARFQKQLFRETLNKSDFLLFVIPAQAGIQQFQRVFWMPAFAGMTAKGLNQSFLSK
jgi:hypothetical protein